MSPDQQPIHLQQGIPQAHTPQFFHVQDGYAIYHQSPPSSVATFDTANAGSGYQSPEVMMGYPQQYYVGPPTSEGYQQQGQQPIEEDGRQHFMG